MKNTISQRAMRRKRVVGKAGMLVHASHKRNLIETFSNAYPQAKAQKTLTIDLFAAEQEYGLTLEGREVTYTALAADTDTAGVAAKLAAEINSDPQVRGILEASAAGSVITLTGLLPGFEFSASAPSADTTLADVAAAEDAEAVPFGRLLVRTGTKTARLPIAGDTAADEFAGLSVFTQEEEAPGEYPANSAMMVLEDHGQMFVENDQGVSYGDPVYVGKAGDERGKLFNNAGADRELIPQLKFIEDVNDGVAIVKVRL